MAKVRHTIFANGKNLGHYNSDITYIKDVPHVVLVWEKNQKGEEYSVFSVALDASKLHPLKNWSDVEYLYELPVELSDEDYKKWYHYFVPNDKL
ncbi:MAG: hypothetical protein HQ566_01945 [Candidatus Omnitrophica bacterium]|nr:hypothetical protein [Candidatus Omnitrophota bacterium]